MAQGNYEVQVYASDLVPKSVTMVELHSNFTLSGTKGIVDGVLPTNHAEHETSKSRTGGTSGSRPGFINSPAFSPTAAGSGWALTFARGSRCRRVTNCRSG